MAHRKDTEGKFMRLLQVNPGWLIPMERSIAIQVQNRRAL
jgi:hypothetical protein